MSITLNILNHSTRKRLYRRDTLNALAETICTGEGLDEELELSVLLCDDNFIAQLNRQYRDKDAPTDVLSFEQEGAPDLPSRVLGDVVISLETVERDCSGDRALMREEMKVLLCHGILHLLGYDHGTAQERRRMTAKQAVYLGLSQDAAWRFGPKVARNGGTRSVGR